MTKRNDDLDLFIEKIPDPEQIAERAGLPEGLLLGCALCWADLLEDEEKEALARVLGEPRWQDDESFAREMFFLWSEVEEEISADIRARQAEKRKAKKQKAKTA